MFVFVSFDDVYMIVVVIHNKKKRRENITLYPQHHAVVDPAIEGLILNHWLLRGVAVILKM